MQQNQTTIFSGTQRGFSWIHILPRILLIFYKLKCRSALSGSSCRHQPNPTSSTLLHFRSRLVLKAKTCMHIIIVHETVLIAEVTVHQTVDRRWWFRIVKIIRNKQRRWYSDNNFCWMKVKFRSSSSLASSSVILSLK